GKPVCLLCNSSVSVKKPFSDGEIVKEAMISAGESLFDGHKDKSSLMSSIKGLQLSHQTVARRVERISDNLEYQLHQDLQSCEYFSLQLDESTDISDVAQLYVFVRMVFGDFTVKEDFVKLLPLLEPTWGEDIFNVFLKFVKECNLPLSKLVAITTDGAPSITGILCAKMLKFDHVMNVVTRVVNYIRSSSTRHRLFRNLLNVSDTEHGDIIFHADIRWLSKLDEISWLLDLAFLTDITSKLNELNLELQGKDRNISSMISVVNAFQKKLKLWIAHLNRNSLSHFPHMKSFSTLEPVTMFISNPFATVDVSELGGEVCEIFGKYNLEELEMEILNFQEDISLKSSFASCSNFWTLVNRNKYSMIHSIVLKIYPCFGSTYLCEVAFSSMSITKNKYRSCPTDSHLDDALRAACSSYTPANMQCQISH
ncbi:hypothetical protein B7P43_G18079, partial [Cryptotermes secundus]